jgi:hypothetical protein
MYDDFADDPWLGHQLGQDDAVDRFDLLRDAEPNLSIHTELPPPCRFPSPCCLFLRVRPAQRAARTPFVLERVWCKDILFQQMSLLET